MDINLSNNKITMEQQTALAYYEIEHRRLLIKFERKEITVGEYAVSSFDLFTKALQMEREQMLEASISGSMGKSFEEFYQTFKP